MKLTELEYRLFVMMHDDMSMGIWEEMLANGEISEVPKDWKLNAKTHEVFPPESIKKEAIHELIRRQDNDYRDTDDSQARAGHLTPALHRQVTKARATLVGKLASIPAQ